MPSFNPYITNLLSQLPDDWKSTILDKKSIMVNIQPNFKVFGQNQDLEVTFIIWSRVDHDSSRKLKIHQKSKVTKLGLSLGEVNWTLTKHNFHIIHQKILNQRPFWWKSNSLQLCLSKLKAQNSSFERYESKHYKSFLKSTKRHFLSKRFTSRFNSSNGKWLS